MNNPTKKLRVLTLDPHHRKFVDEYARGGFRNASQAAAKAGFVKQYGVQLLKRDDVAHEVKRLQQAAETAGTLDWDDFIQMVEQRFMAGGRDGTAWGKLLKEIKWPNKNKDADDGLIPLSFGEPPSTQVVDGQ